MPVRSYREIVDKLGFDITEGKLSFGAPLPPTRELAEKLGVSRDTIVHAYSVLKNLGYIESDGRRGTFVVYKAPEQISKQELSSKRPKLSEFGEIVEGFRNRKETFELEEDNSFNFGAVPKEALPLNKWKEFLADVANYVRVKNPDYKPDILGLEKFRLSLIKFLAHSRDIHCAKENIAVMNISLTAVDILFKLLLERGDCIALERPGYSNIERLARMHRLSTVMLPVDQDGCKVEQLSRLKTKPKLIYLTPDSHDPSGAKLSLKRRMMTLEWAKANDAWIIEDGFDTWFRYGKAAPASLKALDTDGRVFYLSTFWQILYPLVTTSFLILPSNFIHVFRSAKELTDGIAETVPQEFLTVMLDSGYLNGHVRRYNKIFAARRRALIFNLTQSFGRQIEIPSYSAGLHFLVDLGDYDKSAVIMAAKESKLPLRHLSKGKYLCYFAGMEESAIKEIVKDFRARL